MQTATTKFREQERMSFEPKQHLSCKPATKGPKFQTLTATDRRPNLEKELSENMPWCRWLWRRRRMCLPRAPRVWGSGQRRASRVRHPLRRGRPRRHPGPEASYSSPMPPPGSQLYDGRFSQRNGCDDRTKGDAGRREWRRSAVACSAT